ncbi:MAG TPA: hypothetical protein VIQ55_15105, partial [Burkholderiales bacterium]
MSVLALLPAMLLAATCLPSLAATTPKEAAALGRSLADAFNERSVDAFMESVDVDAFTGIVLRELELATTEREAIRRRMPGAVRR